MPTLRVPYLKRCNNKVSREYGGIRESEDKGGNLSTATVVMVPWRCIRLSTARENAASWGLGGENNCTCRLRWWSQQRFGPLEDPNGNIGGLG